jgi:hypothetical protein
VSLEAVARLASVVEMAMTLLTHRDEGPAFPYAGQPVHILAGSGGQPPGFAAMEIWQRCSEHPRSNHAHLGEDTSA